ncbi:MAG: hypothetical protein IPM74_04800 [Crocinitomicaceae bacterium]|nr:hypothetical protein [Crocinitomicaceae bacterium]MBK8925224.1 hypothetical protein [Crocinitomicaceae bacterium]
MKKLFLILPFIVFANMMHAQEQANPAPVLSKAFEKPDPYAEITRLDGKRNNLVIRLQELKADPNSDPAEIARVEGLIKYIDGKLETLHNYVESVEYADEQGKPEQGNLTDEEYKVKLEEWKKEQVEKQETGADPVKTTLTREEFNRLPKERQDIILSMPERYTIVD